MKTRISEETLRAIADASFNAGEVVILPAQLVDDLVADLRESRRDGERLAAYERQVTQLFEDDMSLLPDGSR